MKHIGLFEGIGGFSLSAQLVGWETIAWCEWDAFCQTVLKYHFPHATPHSDIRTTDFTGYHGKIDILTGGFPCQPYSTAGKRKGTDDERHLWPEMRRAIREISPRWVVGENVGGLVNWSGGLVFDEVQADLEAEGYEVQAFVLPACGVDAPHKRDRVWFVAHSKMHNDRGSAGEVSKTNGRQVCELLSELGCSDEAPAAAANANYNGSHGPENRQGLESRNDRNAARANKAVKLARCSVSDAWPTTDADSDGHQLRGLGQDRSAQSEGKGIEKERQRVWSNSWRIGEPETVSNANGAGRRQQLATCQPGWQGFGSGCSNSCNASYPTGSGRFQVNSESKPGLATQNIPDWRQFPTQPPLCSRNDGFSPELVGITVSKHRRESIKAYGNAIVPQVALQIFKAINQIEKQ